jgi:hypothetical protein
MKTVDKADPNKIEQQLSHLRYIHSVAESYKNSITTRAIPVLSSIAVQVALLAGSMGYIPGEKSHYAKLVVWTFFLVALLMHMTAAAILLMSIIPLRDLKLVKDLTSKTTTGQIVDETVIWLSSFNRVVTMDRDVFLERLRNADADALFRDLSITYYNLCCIIDARYRRLLLGFNLHIFGFTLTAGFILFIIILRVLFG